MNISKYIEYTLLDASATERDIINLCEHAIENEFNSICINSSYVALAKQLLDNTSIEITAVVGFPLGATSTKAKIFEAKNAIANGANNIDMVINSGLFKSKNYVSVLRDISDVKFAITNTPLHVIIEISELNKNEIIKACDICLDAKADYIKTSTGFSKSGATLTAVKIIKKTVKDYAKITAFDGIEDLETALKYIEAGADKISVSHGFEVATKKNLERNVSLYKNYLESLKKETISEINPKIENI